MKRVNKRILKIRKLRPTRIKGEDNGNSQNIFLTRTMCRLISNKDLTVVEPKSTFNKRAVLEANRCVYPLKEGVNIVGHKSPSSIKTVQIEIDDLTISRRHCKIILSTQPDGILRAVLTIFNNRSRTLINGQPIYEGDVIRLFDGSVITMGKTIFTFKWI